VDGKSTPTMQQDMDGWRDIHDRLHIWDYTTNFWHYLSPFPNFQVLQPNIQYFINHHVTGLFEQGNGESISGEFGEERDAWLDLLLTQVVEPQLGRGRLTFLYEYPASQAALAQLTADENGNTVAERFELYFAGVELANGYHELADAREQRARFEADNATRRANDQREVPHDDSMIGATARSVMPQFRQLFVADASAPRATGIALDRKLFVARKRCEHEVLDTQFDAAGTARGAT
jgi:elongation factor P--beta-lysine ligase